MRNYSKDWSDACLAKEKVLVRERRQRDVDLVIFEGFEVFYLFIRDRDIVDKAGVEKTCYFLVDHKVD